MLLLLLLLYITIIDCTQRPSLRFSGHARRLHDEPVSELPSPFGNKVYLKNKLLRNLNNFFPNPEETLEVFGAPEDAQEQEHQEQQQPHHHHRHHQQPVESNSIHDPSPSESLAKGGMPPIHSLLENAFTSRERPGENPYPTLIPTEETVPPSGTTTDDPQQTTPFKRRSEGPIVSGRVLDSIRDWRKRLYRAFKSKKLKLPGSRVVDNNIARQTTDPISEIMEFKDITPLVVDKNRQVILSRKEPGWQTALAARNVQTFGRDPSGKITRLFGTEASGYQSKPLNDSPPAQMPNDYQPLTPLPSNRMSYRTPGGRNIVYIPASPVTIQPPAPPVEQRQFEISIHEVTITMPPLTLPPMLTIPPYPPENLLHELSRPYTTEAPYRGQYNSLSNRGTLSYLGANYNQPAAQAAITPPPMILGYGTTYSTDSNVEEDDDNLESECTGEAEVGCDDNQFVSEDKCNSMRLKNIIENNIVPNDAEASKRAVQSAAETETGQYFDTVCGTGFFSYIGVSISVEPRTLVIRIQDQPVALIVATGERETKVYKAEAVLLHGMQVARDPMELMYIELNLQRITNLERAIEATLTSHFMHQKQNEGSHKHLSTT